MSNNQQGFTLIEILTTIVVALIFLLSAFQLTGSIQQLAITGNQTNVADLLAYSNMRQYANSQSPNEWFNCDAYVPGTPVVLINKSGSSPNLPNPVVQHVEVTAPYGCSGASAGLPLRIESYVQYGTGTKRITHATYVSF